jgi:hypothetical protein
MTTQEKHMGKLAGKLVEVLFILTSACANEGHGFTCEEKFNEPD